MLHLKSRVQVKQRKYTPSLPVIARITLVITLALILFVPAISDAFIRINPTTTPISISPLPEATPFEGTAGEGDVDIIDTIVDVVNVILSIVAIIAALFIIIGGFRYIASSGDQESAEAAKNTVIYAVIGLVIIAFAAAIVNFVVAIFSENPA